MADLNDAFNWLCDRAQDRGLRGDEVATVLDCLPRNAGPAILGGLRTVGLLPAEVATACVGEAWCAAEFPEVQLDPAEWLILFEQAG
jgi:hypothetical protein